MVSATATDGRTILRVVLPGTSFPILKPGIREELKTKQRTLRSNDYDIIHENQVARFTPEEWAKIPEETKAKFGFISSVDVQKVALGELQKPIDQWVDKVAAKKKQVAEFEVKMRESEVRNAQTLQAMKVDLAYQEGELLRLQAAKTNLEEQIKVESGEFLASANPARSAEPQEAPLTLQKGGVKK